MKTILITGSPGSGKTSTANFLSELLRESQTHHIVIDPDEIARIFPEDKLTQLKMDALAKLCPLYADMAVEIIIIPMTIDDDGDMSAIEHIFGKQSISVFNLIVEENTLIKRVTEREPNVYWQNKLSELVKAYVRNDDARSFSCIDINVNDKPVDVVAGEINAKARHY